MEVNKSISYHFYSSYCKNLQYDEFVNRYTFTIDSVNDRNLKDFKSLIYKDTGRDISIEQIRVYINNLASECYQPSYRREILPQEILFDDILAGETILVNSPEAIKTINLMKFNTRNWIVLSSESEKYSIGELLGMSPLSNVNKWLEGYEKHFIYSGPYHDCIDRIYCTNLHRSNVAQSVSTLYENILESVKRNRLNIDWQQLIAKAGNMGHGSYVFRRILDSITNAGNGGKN